MNGVMELTGASRPTKAALIGLLVATGVALAGAMGPLVSAVKITIGPGSSRHLS